jgi:hypothetical protein
MVEFLSGPVRVLWTGVAAFESEDLLRPTPAPTTDSTSEFEGRGSGAWPCCRRLRSIGRKSGKCRRSSFEQEETEVTEGLNSVASVCSC